MSRKGAKTQRDRDFCTQLCVCASVREASLNSGTPSRAFRWTRRRQSPGSRLLFIPAMNEDAVSLDVALRLAHGREKGDFLGGMAVTYQWSGSRGLMGLQK